MLACQKYPLSAVFYCINSFMKPCRPQWQSWQKHIGHFVPLQGWHLHSHSTLTLYTYKNEGYCVGKSINKSKVALGIIFVLAFFLKHVCFPIWIQFHVMSAVAFHSPVPPPPPLFVYKRGLNETGNKLQGYMKNKSSIMEHCALQ